jgi:hypothetical protein
MLEKKEIEALHKHDLDEFLNNISLLDDINNKKIHCVFCNEIINKNNIGAIYTKDKEIFFSCSKLECLNNLNT